MAKNMSRRAFLSTGGLASLVLLAGCSGGTASSGSAASSSAASSSSGQVMDGDGMIQERLLVGTLATEDILPLWVAQSEGLFDKANVSVEVVTFQSATELIAGVASGAVNMAMTDIMVTASMFASGIDVQMQWVTLGATADQGRFGIMVGPNSTVTKLEDLAGVPIGVGSNTILEYVMDKLMEGAGIPDDQIVVEELQKLPVRYQAMMSGEVEAAALPGMCAALVPIPVIGIPMKTSDLGGEDSLFSIVQMPSGIPVATVAINGAKNAGILAAKIIAVGDPALMDKVKKYGTSLKEEVKGKNARLHEIGWEKYLEEK